MRSDVLARERRCRSRGPVAAPVLLALMLGPGTVGAQVRGSPGVATNSAGVSAFDWNGARVSG